MLSKFLVAAVGVVSFPSFAYVGPGLALLGFGPIVGLIATILFFVVGIFWKPIKKTWMKIRGKEIEAEGEEVDDE